MTPSAARAFLHNVNLLVKDVAVSRDFYADVFGLRVDERRSAAPAMMIMQSTSGTTISLKARDTEDADKLAGAGDVELGFSTADLDSCHAALERYGVHLTPILELGFGRTFDAQDLDGHHLVVYDLAAENR